MNDDCINALQLKQKVIICWILNKYGN